MPVLRERTCYGERHSISKARVQILKCKNRYKKTEEETNESE